MHSYIDEAYQKEVKAYLHYFFGEHCDALRLFREAFILYFEHKAYISAIMVYSAMKKLNASSENEYKQIKGVVEKNKKKYVHLYYSTYYETIKAENYYSVSRLTSYTYFYNLVYYGNTNALLTKF